MSFSVNTSAAVPAVTDESASRGARWSDPEAKTRLVLLGATGSIGRQTLDVCRMHPDDFELVAVAAHSSVEELVDIALEFGCAAIALGDSDTKGAACLSQLDEGVSVGFGADAIEGLTQLDEVDVVLNALSGEAGMRASYVTLNAGRTLALANKESLVVAGDLIMPLAGGTALPAAPAGPAPAPAPLAAPKLLPVDSEHSAIFQCLMGENPCAMRRIWLTCSGGPFRGYSASDLAGIDASQALAHPTWAMGPKITIDSATLMNKGLEVIEAKHLFGTSVDDIRVVVHPQSCIHSMVEFADGSVKAHLGPADMRIPIQFALTYPGRDASPAQALDFTKIAALEFFDPDVETFGCLALALEAGRVGGTLPCAMNAANEVAVAAFLAGTCGFLDIESCVEAVMADHECGDVESLDQLEEVDARSREAARKFLSRRHLEL